MHAFQTRLAIILSVLIVSLAGEAAAQVAKIYGDAHKIDPDLYRFTRSLESLGKMVNANTSLILRTDSDPFSLLQSAGRP